MKISTEIASCAKHVGEERAIELIAKAGFDGWDFSMFDMARFDYKNRCVIESSHPLSGDGYAEFAKRLAQVGRDCGIECNQSHAPFPVYCKEIRSFLKRAIECTAIAGGKICVIHPDNNASPEKNAEMYFELLPFAKEHGVKIATENMWCWDSEKNQVSFAACMTPESFNAHLDAVNDSSFIACLDLGHAEMRGTGTNAVELIHALGSRLGALHIHDNDKWHDSHAIPRSMDMDFDAIVKALKEIGYNGYFTLEADQHLSKFSPDTVHIGVKELADSARELAEFFERL